MGSSRPTLEQLRALVVEASHANPHLTSRLEKAAFLVLLRRIERIGDHLHRIEAEDGLRSYAVIQEHSECSDYPRHGPGHPCKHRLAITFHSLLKPMRRPVTPHTVGSLNRSGS